MASTYAKLGTAAVAALMAVVAACSTSGEPPGGSSSSNASSAASAQSPAKSGKTDAKPSGEAPVTTQEPATTQAAGGDTVVFEVTGSGSALTIDLVPSGDQRYYDVPLPWSTTVTVGPDVTQLQVVVVGSGEAVPGCRITLNGRVVAEKPEGGDAHCIFDR